MRTSTGVLCFLASIFIALGYGGLPSADIGGDAAAKPPAIVIGFVGAFTHYNNPAHGIVMIAARLRKDCPSGVYIRVFENRHRKEAHAEILRLLDTNHDGKLSDEEKQNARIIIYGHSWGGSEAVTLARKLQKDGIRVLLTIQIDSIAKIGENDSVIPANVAQAVNFYQTHGLLHGRRLIRAADPSRTQIIGNYRVDYRSHPIHCTGYPWFARAFGHSHIEIDCDPALVNRLESLIRSKLPAGIMCSAKGSATRRGRNQTIASDE